MTDFSTNDHNRFGAYEYTSVRTEADRESLYRDTYRNFGWELDGRGHTSPGSDAVSLKFKRDRGIKNRADVVDLQRTCDRALDSVVKAERSVSSTAIAAAAALGVLGAGLLAGSIFALNADLTVMSIILGANGLFAWIAGYFAHGRVSARQSAKVSSVIESNYRIVAETGERAAALLTYSATSPERTVTR